MKSRSEEPVQPTRTSHRHVPRAVLTAATIVILAGILSIGLPRARESARRSACVNNLKQLGLALSAFASEHEGKYPRISHIEGNVIFEGSLVYPKYLTEVDILGCPSDSGYRHGKTFRLKDNLHHPGYNVGEPHPDCITCQSYIYLGWVITNEKEGLAAVESYLKAFSVEGQEQEKAPKEKKKKESTEDLILTNQYKTIDSADSRLEGDLLVPEGKGNMNSSVIHRLNDRADSFTDRAGAWPEVSYPSKVPIMWEWPSHHTPPGGHVLYLDGRVEFHQYPGKFPMTERFIEALRKLKTEFSEDVPPVTNE